MAIFNQVLGKEDERTPFLKRKDICQILEDRRMRNLTIADRIAVSAITDNIFLTGLAGVNRESLKEFKYTHIVNMTPDCPMFEGVECIRFPIIDRRDEDIFPTLIQAADWIHRQLHEANGKVLVHCHAGISRSATVVLAYFVRYRKMSVRSAFNLVAQKRPIIRPNSTFMAELLRLEKETLGTESFVMIYVSKNNRVIEMPSFLPYDLPEKFDAEFKYSSNMNDIDAKLVKDKFVVILEDFPDFFQEITHFLLKAKLSSSPPPPTSMNEASKIRRNNRKHLELRLPEPMNPEKPESEFIPVDINVFDYADFGLSTRNPKNK